jgi:thioredoxin 1
MENIKEGTNDNFKDLISSEKITIVDFWATWCGPCRTLSPILDKIAEENPELQIVKVDVDSNSDLSMQYGIRSIPTVYIFKSGEIVNKFVGLKTKEDILKLIA